jgi:hypothetical protein
VAWRRGRSRRAKSQLTAIFGREQFVQLCDFLFVVSV